MANSSMLLQHLKNYESTIMLAAAENAAGHKERAKTALARRNDSRRNMSASEAAA